MASRRLKQYLLGGSIVYDPNETLQRVPTISAPEVTTIASRERPSMSPLASSMLQAGGIDAPAMDDFSLLSFDPGAFDMGTFPNAGFPGASADIFAPSGTEGESARGFASLLDKILRGGGAEEAATGAGKSILQKISDFLFGSDALSNSSAAFLNQFSIDPATGALRPTLSVGGDILKEFAEALGIPFTGSGIQNPFFEGGFSIDPEFTGVMPGLTSKRFSILDPGELKNLFQSMSSQTLESLAAFPEGIPSVFSDAFGAFAGAGADLGLDVPLGIGAEAASGGLIGMGEIAGALAAIGIPLSIFLGSLPFIGQRAKKEKAKEQGWIRGWQKEIDTDPQGWTERFKARTGPFGFLADEALTGTLTQDQLSETLGVPAGSWPSPLSNWGGGWTSDGKVEPIFLEANVNEIANWEHLRNEYTEEMWARQQDWLQREAAAEATRESSD